MTNSEEHNVNDTSTVPGTERYQQECCAKNKRLTTRVLYQEQKVNDTSAVPGTERYEKECCTKNKRLTTRVLYQEQKVNRSVVLRTKR